MSIINFFARFAMLFDIIFALLMIFKERKKPEVIVSWLLLFLFIPILGFVLYILIGSGLSWKNRKMLKRKKFFDEQYENYFVPNISEETHFNKKVSDIIKFNVGNADRLPTYGNDIKFFIDGKEKMASLIKDVKNAKKSINIEYYIFADDFVGKYFMKLLIEKAKEGLDVNLIYDSVGCLGTPRRFFRKLKKAGGHVKEFFPPLFHIRLLNLKLNYRDHRKIVVIDGKIGYTGGVNIRKDHLGFKKKVAPFRDTHIRVQGPMVYALQNEFLNYWQFCSKIHIGKKQNIEKGYFPKISPKGKTVSQVLASGPASEKPFIKDAMIKMINKAEKEIIILSPYFSPDETYLYALKQALKSGIKVKIMIPEKPDKKLVYTASMSFLYELLEEGAEVYKFQGFIHSKVLIIDKEIMLVGTANADNRSFSLNFEISAILYDAELTKSYIELIKSDFENAKKLQKKHGKMRFYDGFWQLICRLFAPLL